MFVCLFFALKVTLYTREMSTNSSSNSSGLLNNLCTTVTPYMYIASVTLRFTLLIPLSILVLYLGHQRWKQQCSFKTASHADIFTYHMAVMELTGVLGFIAFIYGSSTNCYEVQQIGSLVSFTPFYGSSFFHILTCVERYLAVVHPIVYRGLRNARGVRIRNIIIGCAWLFCFGLVLVYHNGPNVSNIIVSCILGFSVVIISFCSLSVLCVLIRPGPGEEGKQREQADQLKMRAFYTITVVLWLVLLWFSTLFIFSVLSPLLSESATCVVQMTVGIFNIPCSLVLPLLFLQREGKLSCCFFKCR